METRRDLYTVELEATGASGEAISCEGFAFPTMTSTRCECGTLY